MTVAIREHQHQPQVQLATMADRKRGLFGSIKQKFNLSEPRPLEAPISPSSTNPNAAPPTRRPNRPGMDAFTTPSNEPPPAYTRHPESAASIVCPEQEERQQATANSQRAGQAASGGVLGVEDDQFSFLGSFDVIFLIDDSGSMAGRSWRECSLALETITPICTKYDTDGIDILFLNTPEKPAHRNVTSASAVHEIFSTVRPSGGTPTGQRLNSILKPYFRQLQQSPSTTKPLNIIVITDGVPSDDVESVIIGAAKKLDALDAEPWQIGIQMFQVGEEQGAADHLASLDDELSRMGGGCRDIVDTVPFVQGPRGRGIGLSGEGILKVVLGAVNKRLDRRANSLSMSSSPSAMMRPMN